jgi:predicted dithiol-disulfide oxidoreductase (DUF899 family)
MNSVDTTSSHEVVSREQWLQARKAHLAREKEFTRMRDQLNAERLELPWVKVDKQYVFDGPDGQVSLAELFDGRSQLIVQHFMFGPEDQEGCVGCSFLADHIEAALVHLEHHDVSFVRIARAPLARIEAFKQRMGWRARWVSSYGSDFNYDYHVSFTKEERAQGKVDYNYTATDIPLEDLSGTSVFYQDANGEIFHTYSSYGRGGEAMLGTYMLLDVTPKGRNETGPNHNLTDWVRHHDKYGAGGFVAATGHYVPAQDAESCGCSQ